MGRTAVDVQHGSIHHAAVFMYQRQVNRGCISHVLGSAGNDKERKNKQDSKTFQRRMFYQTYINSMIPHIPLPVL